MKKILIATRNKDKFELSKKMLLFIFNDYEYYYLDDIKESIIDLDEEGDILNRAYTKANNVFNNLKKNDYEYIIGIDDGIEVNGSVIEDIKAYLDDIINDQYFNNGDLLYIKKAFAFIRNDRKHLNIEISIPFKYQTLDHPIEEKTFYPLNHVITPINDDTCLANMKNDDYIEYCLIYAKEKLLEVKNYFA